MVFIESVTVCSFAKGPVLDLMKLIGLSHFYSAIWSNGKTWLEKPE